MLRRLVGLALIGITAVATIRIVPKLDQLIDPARTDLGWDLKVVCSALQALSSGHDPYLESKPFALPYGILHVYLFEPLCPVADDRLAYIVVYSLVAAVSAVILWLIVPPNPIDRIAVLAAAFVGFDAFNWQLATGNVAIIELPLAVAMVLLLAKRKYVWAGGVFGLMASLKLLPFLGVVAFLVMPETKRLRLWSVASATGSLLAIHGLNAVLFGRWLPSYAAQLTARVPGSPGYEGGGVYNQNSIDFVTDGFRQLGLDHPLPGFALACLGLGIGWLTSLACARKTHAQAELPAGAVVALVMLIVWLFLFRQKNYAFETFIPFMVFVGYSAGRATALTAIAASIIVPAAFVSRTVTMPSLEPYYQLLGAWAAVLVLLVGGIVQLRRRERPVPGFYRRIV